MHSVQRLRLQHAEVPCCSFDACCCVAGGTHNGLVDLVRTDLLHIAGDVLRSHSALSASFPAYNADAGNCSILHATLAQAVACSAV